MTRAEIEAQYKCHDGIIVSPGKFEGEPIFAPALYDLMCEGFSDILDYPDDTRIDIFETWPVEDYDTFADFRDMIDADTAVIALTESETGFVHVVQLSAAAYQRLKDENEKLWDEHHAGAIDA